LVRQILTLHVDVSIACNLAVSSLSNSTAQHATWRAQLTQQDKRDRRDSQLSLLCNLYKLYVTSYSI